MPPHRNALHERDDAGTADTATPHPPSPTGGRPAGPSTDAQRVALAWRALRRGTAARRMRALAWAPDPPQLNMGQIDSLDLLVTRRSWTMCDFAAALGIDPSTATRAIDRLVDIGLAEREHSPTDKRVTLVHATQTGRDTQRRVAHRRLGIVTDALDTFTDTEQHTLADLLDRLVAALDDAVDALTPASAHAKVAQRSRGDTTESARPPSR